MAAVWAQTIAALDSHRLVAVASRQPAAAARVAAPFGATVVSLAAGPPLDGPASDLTVVAGVPGTHAADAGWALGRSSVVVEGPMCTTLADADRLVAAAEGGAFVACAENLLYAPLVRDALHRVSMLGPRHYLEARVVQAPPPHWTPRDAAWGGGVLFDTGVHALAVLLAVAGDDHPVSVDARFERALSSAAAAVEDRAVVRLRFASGANGVLDVRWQAGAAAQWDLQVATGGASLRLELLPDPHLELQGVDLPRPPRRFPGVEPAQLETFGYLDQAWELGREASAGGRPWLGATFGRYVLDVVCAAYRSAGTGAPEALPFTGPRELTPWQLWRGV